MNHQDTMNRLVRSSLVAALALLGACTRSEPPAPASAPTQVARKALGSAATVSLVFDVGALASQDTASHLLDATTQKTFPTLDIKYAGFFQDDSNGDGLFGDKCTSNTDCVTGYECVSQTCTAVGSATQGNDLEGTLKLFLDNGQVLSLPGAINFRVTTGNTTELFGFIFSPATVATAPVASLLYGAAPQSTFDIIGGGGGSPSTSMLLRSYFSTTAVTDGTGTAGVYNAATADLIDELNAQLAATAQPFAVTVTGANGNEAGPVPVRFRVELDKTTTLASQLLAFSLSGTASAADRGAPTFLPLDLNGDPVAAVITDNGDGTLSLPPGIRYFDVLVLPVDDSDTEVTETVILATGTRSASANILDNDGPSDSDGDGILDTEEGTGDFDGDGIVNKLDLDSDNDGIPDSVEAGANPASPVNTDGTPGPDYLDNDADGDGLVDALEAGHGKPFDAVTGRVTGNVGTNGLLDAVETADTLLASLTYTVAESPEDVDTTPDYQDLDSDGDGLNDDVEGASDTDGDGTPDSRDPDSDNDGIPDSVEKGTLAQSNDFDGDGIPNHRDLDSDNDGIPDAVEAGASPETPVNTDGTTGPDYLDNDADGDGLVDALEAGHGKPFDAVTGRVTGNVGANGLLDAVESADTYAAVINYVIFESALDADTIPDYQDLDSDGDGVNDAVDNCKSIPNADQANADGTNDGGDACDYDDDNDGVDDETDNCPVVANASQLNSDGTSDGGDACDADDDNDGIPDTDEGPGDSDNDGTPDAIDNDSDNDGIPDSIERGTAQLPADTDQDGVPDYRDLDSDNDGITDELERGADIMNPANTDGDSLPDYLDLDADGDGIPDVVEAGHGKPVSPEFRLSAPFGANGLADAVETSAGSGIPNYTVAESPLDADETRDFQDLDSDGDGHDDALERGADGLRPADTDGDGKPNYLDLDSDNDCVPDAQESILYTANAALPNAVASDNCTAPGLNFCDTTTGTCVAGCDTDSDCGVGQVCDATNHCAPGCRGVGGNGCPADSYCTSTTTDVGVCDPDTDKDGIPDLREKELGTNPNDPDSDKDGIPDGTETNGGERVDTDNDGVIDALDTDSDNDGIPDSVEKGTGGPVDTDKDGTPDYRDLDSDDDGIPDSVEKGTGGPVDTDQDGAPDYLDLDSDADGIPDATEKGPDGAAPLDTDGDGTFDFRDLDSDNDSLLDAAERGPEGAAPRDTDKDGLPDYRDLDGTGLAGGGSLFGCSALPGVPGAGWALLTVLSLASASRRRRA
jgi:hypothetical protein